MTRLMIVLIFTTLAINCYGLYTVASIETNYITPKTEKTVLGHRVGPGGQLMLVTK